MMIDDVITLRKLEVLLTFMQVNNLTRASELLGQSAVSVHRALHSLEEGLRCPLFKREGRKLVPLPAAYAFANYAERALGEVDKGVRKAREVAGFDTVSLKMGSLYSLTLRCVPQLMTGLRQRKPELRIDLTMGSNRELFQGLADGVLDAAVVGVAPVFHHPELQSVPLFDDSLYLAAPAPSPYAGRGAIDLLDLRHEKFVRLADGFATAESFDHAFGQAGYRPEIAVSVGDIFSLINLIGGGLGYSLLPGRVADFSPRMQLLPLAPRYASSQRVTLLFPRNRERDPKLLALAAESRLYRHAGGQAGQTCQGD
ncbi:LysR family malonate utilization transcriptional regulator [Duganella sp. 1224]|uniref:LysR family transcriptional regulator n=1 Tax=Duganella sp. 1224 TaxID=2587052 RepID=UPI0015C716EB|nr:LysR family transcriptional regulator [Duganella sp. 1224]NYE58855.1 LysR family malonate utilization transcriptional regulator [Duganella sp. 1224]